MWSQIIIDSITFAAVRQNSKTRMMMPLSKVVDIIIEEKVFAIIDAHYFWLIDWWIEGLFE